MTLRRLVPATGLFILVVNVAIAIVATVVPTSAAALPNQKISARVLDETGNGGATEALVVLAQQADLAPAAGLRTKLAKGRFVFNSLREVANRTQAPMVALLRQRGIPYQSFWIVNMIQVTGNRALLEELAARAEVKQIDANPYVRSALPVPTAFDTAQPTGVEWNVTKVKSAQGLEARLQRPGTRCRRRRYGSAVGSPRPQKSLSWMGRHQSQFRLQLARRESPAFPNPHRPSWTRHLHGE